MKFFIDFEAMQYSEYIISIGCVSENGNEFSTLVKPSTKKKLTTFITDLTGITNEMLEGQPSPDTAFLLLMEFVKEECGDEIPEWYCYGKEDKKFIERTLHKMYNFYAIIFAQSIMGNLHDYSNDVKEYFNNFKDNAPSLFKTYLFLTNQDDDKQKHEALEDARMLKMICENLAESAAPEDAEKIYSIKVAPKPSPNVKGETINLPQYVIDWTHLAGKKNMWKVCQFSKLGGKTEFIARGQDGVAYFSDIDQAVFWVNYYLRKVPLKDKKVFEKTKTSIYTAIKQGKSYCGMEWERVI